MRHQVEMTDTAALMAGTEEDIARAATRAMTDVARALKEDWRSEIVAAGLGRRLALTIRDSSYPRGGAVSLDPAGWVWTKAPMLIDVYSRGAMIQPTGGRRYLAIPTKWVPRRGRKRMSPVEVEASFNQDLIIRRGRGQTLLTFVDAVRSRRGDAARQATRRRLAQGRVRRLILMFVLVPTVRVQKRLDLAAIAARAADRFPTFLSARWTAIPDRTAPMRRR